jgi:hypothetical protein
LNDTPSFTEHRRGDNTVFGCSHRRSLLLKACWRSAMAWKEISCAASDRPMINPVSCWGKKPLGNQHVEISGHGNGAEHCRKGDEAVSQDNLEARLIELEQAIEATLENR